MTLRDAFKTLTDGKFSVADLAALAFVLSVLASSLALAYDRLALDEPPDAAGEDASTG